jgi:4'-phosphopantetheinyl transferase
MDFRMDQRVFGETCIYFMHYADFDPADHLHHLTAQELERYHTFHHLKRRREFVATRILRHAVFGFEHIHYNAFGAPYITGAGFISISHAENLIGIAANPGYALGLDLELVQEKALRLKSKFLNAHEYAEFDTTDAREMTRCWSAKETLYKLAGRKKILFKEELHLYKDTPAFWKGEIINPTEKLLVNLHIFDYEAYIVSFNASAIVQG